MKNKILIIALIASLLVNIFLGVSYFQDKSVQIESDQLSSEQREKISEFTKLFFTKIVVTGGKISFEDRAKIEEDLKNLNDSAISEKWNNFISSDSGGKAQGAVTDMMIFLADRLGN